MSECRQIAGHRAFSNPLILPAGGHVLYLGDKLRHIRDRSEMTRAVESHLGCSENVSYGLCVEARQVSRHHVRSGRAVMDLDCPEGSQNAFLRGIHLSLQKQAENCRKGI